MQKKTKHICNKILKYAKDSLAEANNKFEIERKLDENSKSFGQPVMVNMDSKLYDHDIDKSGAFGGVIDENYCLQLMSNSESIVGELMDFLLAQNSRIYGISDHKIKEVCDTIVFFFQALDGYISGILMKIFHLRDKISEK